MKALTNLELTKKVYDAFVSQFGYEPKSIVIDDDRYSASVDRRVWCKLTSNGVKKANGIVFRMESYG
jgi:hypothetical protein